ncbi:MAG: hypothetical protein JW910_17610, partial [Anaerolineae bacterium]|nr:hypothetical protein [Anaerolineae bacterium]
DATGTMGPQLFFMLPYDVTAGSYDTGSGLASGVSLSLPDEGAEFFTLADGSVTIDQVVEGQNSLYVFGTFDFNLTNNDGQAVHVTGQFARARTHIE